MKELDADLELSQVDKVMIGVLKKSKEPLTVYKIAKETKTAWSTANTHCYKLEAEGILERKIEQSRYGKGKTFWKLKVKEPTLDKFIK